VRKSIIITGTYGAIFAKPNNFLIVYFRSRGGFT